MKRDFGAFKNQFDLIIIGGGMIGTGIARDAALRGLQTLLIEKEDFANGTTSRSSRLIHGGLRYLRTLDFKLVMQDLREREILLKIAPHLVHELRFVIPLLRSEPYYRFTLPFGLFLYDILAAGKSLPSRNQLSREDSIKIEPSLADTRGLMGSLLYYDCQAEFMERLCLENAQDASEHGASILNHTVMTEFLIKDNTVIGIKARDAISGEEYEARGRIIVNAGGPWADIVSNRLQNGSPYTLRKTKGIHLLTDKLSANALVLFAKSDGRLFFVIPWQDYSLIGTTDTKYTGDLDKVQADASDVNYLVSELQNYFPDFKENSIHYAIAGLRPLVPSEGKTESNTSRAHKVFDHELRDGIKGLISVFGGKITAYRAIAEEVSDLTCGKLGRKLPCRTSFTPLPGAPAVLTATIKQASQTSGLSVETISHLAALYGLRFSEVLEYVSLEKRLGQPVSPGFPDILAQIKFAVEKEEALTLSDFMLRRSDIGLGPSQGTEAAETVAHEMGLLLGWNDEKRRSEIDAYRSSVVSGRRFTEHAR
jgi:glycerol-3-phosphate dehydrogenase